MEPLIVTTDGRAHMLRHLVRDHGMRPESSLSLDEIVVMWWMHGHELNETNVAGCGLLSAAGNTHGEAPF